MSDFDRGSWDAFNQVLNWINTWPEQSMNKSKLYAAVMEMRPKVDCYENACSASKIKGTRKHAEVYRA